MILVGAQVAGAEIRDSDFTFNVTCPHCGEPVKVTISQTASTTALPTRAEQEATLTRDITVEPMPPGKSSTISI
jgi:phage terminase large subunit GpA-like protein